MESTLNPGGKLSPIESRILWLLSIGHQQRGIARILGVSPKTVHSHTERMKAKLKCNHHCELIVIATEERLTTTNLP